MSDWTREEALIVAGSRLLHDDRIVFAGIGAPLVAAALAQRVHAPGLTIVLEGGCIGAKPRAGALPTSTNEMRSAHGSEMLTGIVDVFLYAQRGLYDYGFVGVGQIDRFGNVNTSVIGPRERPAVRLPGSGGANDIVSHCREILLITKHERRRFVERVDFRTSPGYLGGGDERALAGLTRGRPTQVMTDLALFDFEPTSHELRLQALQPGVEVDEVQEATGFELLVSPVVGRLTPPTVEELHVLRELCEGPPPAA
jgi:glutaconate CoA-transferase subunit B